MIVKWFLNARHWQIFLLVFGIPMFTYMAMMVYIFSTAFSGTPPDFAGMAGFMALAVVCMAISTGSNLMWQWSIAMGLKPLLPDVHRNEGRFKVFFFFPIVYVTAFLLLIIWLMLQMPSWVNSTAQPEPDIDLIGLVMLIVFPLHFFAMFCVFYVLYFVSKSIKMVELKREVSFSEFLGEFFLIWFYPIGVWIIQPKINRLASELP